MRKRFCNALHSSSYHLFWGIVPDLVCLLDVLCGKLASAALSSVRARAVVMLSSDAVRSMELNPVKTVSSYMSAVSWEKWMVVCGVSLVGVCHRAVRL